MTIAIIFGIAFIVLIALKNKKELPNVEKESEKQFKAFDSVDLNNFKNKLKGSFLGANLTNIEKVISNNNKKYNQVKNITWVSSSFNTADAK